MVDNPTLENLWRIKVFLRGFGRDLGLKVNFLQSSIIGVNVDLVFLSSDGDFIQYEIDSLPFKYFGYQKGKVLDFELLGLF